MSSTWRVGITRSKMVSLCIIMLVVFSKETINCCIISTMLSMRVSWRGNWLHVVREILIIIIVSNCLPREIKIILRHNTQKMPLKCLNCHMCNFLTLITIIEQSSMTVQCYKTN